MLFNLHFVNNTILIMLLFLLFLVTDIFLFNPVIIAQMFNPIAELVIPIRIPTKEEEEEEEEEEMEIHPLIAEDKIRKYSVEFRVVQKFLCFLLINSFRFISSNK